METLTVEKVADLVRHDFKAAYDKRTRERQGLSKILDDLTLSVEYAGARANSDMMLGDALWEAFAYISKHLDNATGHPAGANPDIDSFTNREVLRATMQARTDAENRLRDNDGDSSFAAIMWLLAHRHADRAFLQMTSPVATLAEQQPPLFAEGR